MTDEFTAWWFTLDQDDQQAVGAAVDLLGETGPGLVRPLVDTIKTSRHPNMKELRPLGAHLRVMFAFDPRRYCDPIARRRQAGTMECLVRREYPACRPDL